jgi:hypothetical protein
LKNRNLISKLAISKKRLFSPLNHHTTNTVTCDGSVFLFILFFFSAKHAINSAPIKKMHGEWQLDYETQDELRQYYSTTQRELYVGKYPQSIEIIHEYRASSYLEQTVSASHRSWRSWKVFPNEVHQQAESLLRVWSTGNSLIHS